MNATIPTVACNRLLASTLLENFYYSSPDFTLTFNIHAVVHLVPMQQFCSADTAKSTKNNTFL